MTKAPGTVDFMPPEALEDGTNIRYGKELDVFSFGCVMLHTLSHQWPTPSQAVIINPETGLAIGGRTEVERRSRYFDRIDRSRSDVLIPLIKNCLGNLPKNRPSIVRVCDQLEGQLVDRESNEFTVSELQQKDAELRRKDTEIQRKDFEIQRKDFEIQRKAGEIQQKDTEIQMKVNQMQERDTEIQRNYREIQHLTATLHDKDVMLETLRLNMSKLQITTSHSLPKKVSKQCMIFDYHYLCDVSGQ